MDEAFRLLDRVGLLHMADKRADELSGGQRQRVGICRALIQNPKLLLVDEPTASLDPKTSRQIMRLIGELCAERGLAAIINIHDVALAQMFVARVIGLRAGAIEFDGPPHALTPDVLTTIYGEEDWEATIRKADDKADEDALGRRGSRVSATQPRRSRRDPSRAGRHARHALAPPIARALERHCAPRSGWAPSPTSIAAVAYDRGELVPRL